MFSVVVLNEKSVYLRVLGGRENKFDVFSCQFLVDPSKGFELVLGAWLVLSVENAGEIRLVANNMGKENLHFDQLRSIESNSCSLSNDFGGETDVIKNSFVNSSESSASWSFLLVWGSGSLGRSLQNSSLSNDYNVLSAELFLQFSDKSVLNLVELSNELERNSDNDNFLG